jgi:hypothetical protein
MSCRFQEPYVRAWSHAYRDDGLVVIGVHTPEFSFEHEVDGVRRAARERAIDYPVAVDNEYAIWSAFANRYWPALYFVDREGISRDQQFGEGRYERSELEIQRLLGVERELVSIEGVGVEAPADWDNLLTPETYLGYARGPRPSSERPDRLRLNQWTLAGEWTLGPENATLDQADGSIAFRFEARDAHLVLSRATREPIPFSVRLDGEAPGSSHGVDVDQDGSGVLRDGRIYQLARQQDPVRQRTLEITSSSLAPRRTPSRSGNARGSGRLVERTRGSGQGVDGRGSRRAMTRCSTCLSQHNSPPPSAAFASRPPGDQPTSTASHTIVFSSLEFASLSPASRTERANANDGGPQSSRTFRPPWD